MKLTSAVANEIIARAKIVLNRAIIVTDENGLSLGGGKEGQIIVDALRGCQEGRIIRSTDDRGQIAWCPFVYDGHTIGAFGIIEEGVQVTPEAIGLLQGLAEVIAHQQFVMEHIQPTEKMRANFLRQMLTANTIDINETYRQADILQINLRQPQAIILIEVENLEREIIGKDTLMSLEDKEAKIAAECSKIRTVILEAFNNHPGNMSSYIGNDLFVLSKGIGGEGLNTRNTMRFLMEKANYVHDTLRKAVPQRVVSLGVGQYYPDLGGLRKSFQEAKLSLNVGTKVWGTGRVYHIKQVGMFVTLANVAQERKAELAHQILHPLLRDEQLYKTVRTFLGSGLNLTEAAEQLHVHRNTLIYRLDKTKKVIGLDPRVFDDALQIKLGLMFYQEV